MNACESCTYNGSIVVNDLVMMEYAMNVDTLWRRFFTDHACNVCNGPGDVYSCGCTNVSAC